MAREEKHPLRVESISQKTYENVLHRWLWLYKLLFKNNDVKATLLLFVISVTKNNLLSRANDSQDLAVL